MDINTAFLNRIFSRKDQKYRLISLQTVLRQGGINSLHGFLEEHKDQQWAIPSQHPSLLPSLILHLLTASLIIKIFLFKEGKIGQVSFLNEFIGMMLAVFIIVRKRGINRRQVQRLPQGRVWKIRRGRQIVNVKGLERGDLVLINQGDLVPGDGLLLKVETPFNTFDEDLEKNIVVIENKGKSDEIAIAKHAFQDCNPNNWLDPFLFQGSTVELGSAWMLLCREHSIPQLKMEENEPEIKELQLIQRIKNITKMSIAVPAVIFVIKWLLSGNYEGFMRLFQVLTNLVVYLTFLDEDQVLRDFKSYLVSLKQSSHFTVQNSSFLVKFSQNQLFVLEDRYRDSLQSLSLLNISHNIKIATMREAADIQKDFAQEINAISIFSENKNYSLRQKFHLLQAAKFIEASPQKLDTKYLTLLQQMGFQIITVKQDCLQSCKNQQVEEWIQFKERHSLGQVLMDLEVRSLKLRKLYECYKTVIINSCIEVEILVLLACFGYTLNLNFSILAVLFSQSSLQNVLTFWKGTCKGWGFREDRGQQYNIVLSIFYLFTLKEFSLSEDKHFLLFMIIFTNRLFRTESMTFSLNFKIFAQKYLIVLGFLSVRVLFGWLWQEKGVTLDDGLMKVCLLPFLVWACWTFLLNIK